MTRREFLRRSATLGLSVSTVALLEGCGIIPGATPPSTKIPRIGMLAVYPSERVEAFRQGLREFGYIEGKSITIEYRDSSQEDRLPALVSELIGLNVETLVTTGVAASVAAKNATSTIPIVFIGIGDPVGASLVASFAHPGGNVTGMSNGATLVTGKRLDLLKEIIPGISRVVVSQSLNRPNPSWDETQQAAQQLGLELQLLEYGRPEDFERALASAMSKRPEALYSLDSTAYVTVARIAELATKSRLPSNFNFRAQIIEGGLMSYGANQNDIFYRAAAYVNKILKGSKPVDLPVQNPIKFEFVINLKTANELGLTFPQSILAQATEVIQ